VNRYLLISFVVLVGCNGGGGAAKVATHKVTGKVTMGGSAVAGATVTFSPEKGSSPAAMGLTDAQGVYTLTTYAAGDGAPEGDYKVLVYKEAPKSEASSGPQHDPKAGGTPQGPPGPKGHGGSNKKGGPAGSLLPEKYSSASDTPLKKTVKSGENTIDLEL
jgi:hypothetical protein